MAPRDQLRQLDHVLARDDARALAPARAVSQCARLVVPQVADDEVRALDAGDLGSSEETEQNRLPGPEPSGGT
jgi:hypothetical protein